jgi:hypothetical protein
MSDRPALESQGSPGDGPGWRQGDVMIASRGPSRRDLERGTEWRSAANTARVPSIQTFTPHELAARNWGGGQEALSMR